MKGSRRLPGAALVIILMVAGTALAMGPAVAQEDSATVVAGAGYAAGPIHRALLGDRYRDTWTTPVRVPVLDLDRFGGGLTAVREGGGVQTSSIRFEAPDGREYNFRSVDKSYSESMPEWGEGTLLEWLRQDQTSAQHPAAAIVATALLEAVGILHPGPRLVVMPDHPRLGEFREKFAGMLGTIELHPNEGEDDEPLFAGSRKVAGGDRVVEHLEEEPEHRVDGAAFLAERLMSVYLGDWDRHVDQYRFARYERAGIYRWVVIPEDRDYAFVHHDGLLLGIARNALTARLVRFEEEHPDLTAMLSNSQELARRLLSEVDRPTWDSVAHAIHARLTDPVIDRAVAAMPDSWLGLTGLELATKLRGRRDRFLTMADELYRLLARTVEVYGTEEDDVATAERHEDGALTVRLTAPGNEDLAGRPYYERRFRPAETREVRIHLEDGDDRAVIRGARRGDILLRVVGGPDDDLLEDSVGVATVLYDAEGDNRIVAGPRTRFDPRPYEPPTEGFSVIPNKPRHSGSESSLLSPRAEWRPDAGLVVGGGPQWTRYGFRHDPYASRNHVAAMVNPGSWRGVALYEGDFRPENSPSRFRVRASASNVERVRFHGLGNASPRVTDAAGLNWLRRVEARARWDRPWVDDVTVELAALLRYSDPELMAGTILDQARPYGAAPLTEAGMSAGLGVDTRDHRDFPRRGLHARLGVDGYLPFEDGRGPFATPAGRAATFLPVPFTSAILALRAGGEILLGQAPVHALPALGGRGDLRGFSQDRFTGDALAHGTAELRVPLFPANLVARGTVGVSGLMDAGRVWLDGESPAGWHTAAGAALWFTTAPVTVAVEWAHGEKDSFYVRLGTGF